MGFVFDPYAPGFTDDPYTVFDSLRSAEPLSWQEPPGLMFVSRHRDVAAILRDRRFGRDIVDALGPIDDHREVPAAYPMWSRYIRRGAFLDREGDYHTRLRAMVARHFTKKRVAELRPRLEAEAELQLDEIGRDGITDLIDGYAVALPLRAIGDLLGIPGLDRHRLITWSRAIVGLYEIEAGREVGIAAEAATVEFVDYLTDLISMRRADPGNDLLSALAHDEGINNEELIGTAILLLNAGHEATVHAIGNSVHALLTHPDQLDLLRSGAISFRKAVDELLRFDTPLQMFERWVTTDIDWDGHLLAAGSKVGLLMGAANRDPAVFANPGALDLRRDASQHVSFGGGAHFCLGAPLGRLEIEIALERLVRRYPDLGLAGDAVRIDGFVFRGFKTLLVGTGGDSRSVKAE
ncbi:MAG: cytochrome P450 [Acidimicrobiia bacterium]|nr:cytochrome P450 [Acidimicrobiia bacterium]